MKEFNKFGDSFYLITCPQMAFFANSEPSPKGGNYKNVCKNTLI